MQLNIPASKATDNQIHTENVKTNPAPEVSELNRYIMKKAFHRVFAIFSLMHDSHHGRLKLLS
jgi:ssDNA-specific exonuclease RecJ